MTDCGVSGEGSDTVSVVFILCFVAFSYFFLFSIINSCFDKLENL